MGKAACVGRIKVSCLEYGAEVVGGHVCFISFLENCIRHQEEEKDKDHNTT